MTSRRFALRRVLTELTSLGVAARGVFGRAGPTTAGPEWQTQNPASGGVANVREFGARGDGVADDSAAIQAAIDSLTRGGVVLLPVGTYRILRSLRIASDGIVIEGMGGHNAGSLGAKPTAIDASALPSGASAIVAVGPNTQSTMKHLKFRRFYLDMSGAGSGGAGILAANCSNVDVEDVGIQVLRGDSCAGIQFGDRENGAMAAIVSSIRGCTVVCNGTPVLVGPGSTSISIEQTYALAAGVAGIAFKSATYCAVTACAVDSGGAGAFGYRVVGSTESYSPPVVRRVTAKASFPWRTGPPGSQPFRVAASTTTEAATHRSAASPT